MSTDYDVAVVGGGILGLATARALQRQRPGLKLVLLEKEQELASHQTGHNSGVLHSGVYYTPGSLKAELCRRGKEQMEAFAAEHEIPHRKLGKLIVALDDSELGRLPTSRAARSRTASPTCASSRDGRSRRSSPRRPASARCTCRTPA